MEKRRFNGLVEKIKSELTQYQFNHSVANIHIFVNIIDRIKRLCVECEPSRNQITIKKYIVEDNQIIDTHHTMYVLTYNQYKMIKELFNV